MKKRNFHAPRTVYSLATIVSIVALGVALGATGCASTASQTRDAATEDKDAQVDEGQAADGQIVDRQEPGPFEVAVDWASAVSTKTPPAEVREEVGTWKTARVARVWASGGEYRAVVVQKNTARETLAVLLHIARSDAGKWEVVTTEATTSTHLWSEF